MSENHLMRAVEQLKQWSMALANQSQLGQDAGGTITFRWYRAHLVLSANSTHGPHPVCFSRSKHSTDCGVVLF